MKQIYIYIPLLLMMSCMEEPDLVKPVIGKNNGPIKLSSPSTTFLSYYETITDSTKLPIELERSSLDFKEQYVGKQESQWFVEITVPDPNINDFRVERELIIPSDFDLAPDTANQIWKTVVYNGILYSYNASDVLLSQEFLPPAIEPADLSTMPIIYADSTEVSDSTKQEFENSLIAQGQSISNSNNEIISETSYSAEGRNVDLKAWFSGSHLLPIKSIVEEGGQTIFQEELFYINVGEYRINNKSIETSYSELDINAQNYLTSAYPHLAGSQYLFNVENVRIVELTNINYYWE